MSSMYHSLPSCSQHCRLQSSGSCRWRCRSTLAAEGFLVKVGYNRAINFTGPTLLRRRTLAKSTCSLRYCRIRI